MLDLDVVAQGRLVPVALMAVSDGAAEHSLDFGCLPAVVALFLGEARNKELHAEHLFMFFHIFLYRKKDKMVSLFYLNAIAMLLGTHDAKT